MSRQELKKNLVEDAVLYKTQQGLKKKLKNWIVTNPINTQHHIYSYVRNLRYAEYHYTNSLLNGLGGWKSVFHTIMLLFYYWRLRRNSYKTGLQIPPFTCGAGLQIWHYGYIIINEKTRCGKNLVIYPGVEIGHKDINGGCPVIGDNVFIGAGSKIFGNINIGNNVTIAANSVVVNDIPENAIVGGVPAKVIKYKK